MKKNILFMGSIVLSLGLMAYPLAEWNQDKFLENSDIPTCELTSSISDTDLSYGPENYSDFFYEMGPRFSPIKRSTLLRAESVEDFLSMEEKAAVDSYRSVSVIIIENDKQTDKREVGYSKELTDAQINLLQSAHYSSGFTVKADYVQRNVNNSKLIDHNTSPHLTVVPEHQAYYEPGKRALLNFLAENNRENTADLNEDRLFPAKLYFTVTKEGKIDKLRLDRSSGYKRIDDSMLKLMQNTPGKWIPAKNEKGENVEQELVLSFGMIGC